MLYFLMLVTAVVLWRTLEIHLFIAALLSVIFWSIVGAIISAFQKKPQKEEENEKKNEQ